MNFDESATALAYDAAFWAMAFDDEDYDLIALGDIALEVGRKFRALGIMGLLATGDNSHLHDNLRLSGEYRVKYLQRVVTAQRYELHHFVLGRVHPVFDLIAAGENTLLASLMDLSPSDLHPQREYLADHCYINLLAAFSLSGSAATGFDEGTVRTSLEQYEQWLNGETDPRFEICTAFANSDEAAFLDAFHMLLAQRLNDIEEHRDTDLEDAIIAAERFIFVEGLALLRIARLRSFEVDQEFALCPRSALNKLETELIS